MSALASVLPFLAALKKQVPDMSGMTADSPDPVDMSGNVSAPSQVAAAQQPPMGPPAASSIPQQDPQPDMTIGAPPGLPPPPPNPVGDIAQSMTQGQSPKLAPETKGHALLKILQGGLVGGLSGLASNANTYAATGRNAGFGGGAAAGYTQALPFQRGMQALELQKAGLTNEQLIQMLPFLRAQNIAGLQKITAEAQKFGAEAAAIPIKSKLEEAQTAAALWKEEPATGLLRNVQTGESLSPGDGGMAILDAPSAAVLGKQPGDHVPLKIAKQAKDLADEGVTYQQANGHNWLVDKQGNKLKDMGVATPVYTFNLQNAGVAGNGGQPSAMAQAVAKGDMAWKDVISPRTPMSIKSAFLNEVKQINPAFNSGDFDVEKQAKTMATSGSVGQQLLAIGTAREHMKLFSQLADKLDNNDLQAANKIGNYFGIQFGSDKATNLKIAAQAFGGEVGRAFDGAGVVAAEREKATNAYADYLSKGQFKGAVQTVDALLAGKQKAAHEWFDKATQAQPDFGQTSPTNTPQPTHRYNPQTKKIEAIP